MSLTQDPSADFMTGGEYLEWDQPATPEELARLHFVARLDGVRITLNPSCDTTPGRSGFHCSSPLPPFMPGRHVIDLTAVALDGDVASESDASRLEIIKIGNQSNVRAASHAGESPNARVALSFETQDGVRLVVDTYASNLNGPVAMTFAPDGSLFIVEQGRQIRVIGKQGAPQAGPALTVGEALDPGESGRLVDIAVHPDFATNRQVYVLCAAQAPGRPPTYRLERFSELNGVLSQRIVLLDRIPVSSTQRGGIVRVGPDRRLYLGLEDLDARSVAQDLGSLNGKILRLNEDGTVPGDNPFGSPVFSHGHSTPVGLAWQPETRDLWEIERGAKGEDELNLATAGADYGWPDPALASRAGAQVRVSLGSSLEPAGATFYSGALIPEFRGDLFFVSGARGALYRVRFDVASHRRVTAIEPLFENLLGRPTGVISGPDGAVYVITSDQAATTDAQPGHHRILRIVPAS